MKILQEEEKQEEQEEQEEEEEDDEYEAAVVRAFVASTDGNKTARRPPSGDAAEWTVKQIDTWLGRTLDLALKAPSRDERAKVVWRKWAEVEEHIPEHVRTGFVQFLDGKLHAKGFPSLRQLVS